MKSGRTRLSICVVNASSSDVSTTAVRRRVHAIGKHHPENISDVIAALSGHTRVRSLIILPYLGAYAVCALLLPKSTNYRLFNRKYEI